MQTNYKMEITEIKLTFNKMAELVNCALTMKCLINIFVISNLVVVLLLCIDKYGNPDGKCFTYHPKYPIR